MDFGHIDRTATAGTSAAHHASPSAKLIAFALTVAAITMSVNVLVVAGICAALIGVAMALRLPMRTLLTLGAYPGLLAAVFAVAASAGLLELALVVAKACTAAAAALLVVLTTPYPAIFAPIQRVLPPLVGDALLMTYRSLFLLVERFSHVLTAARLRAGVVGRRPLRSARLITSSLASSVLYSVDLSQRTYDVMYLRGYEGRIVAGHGEGHSNSASVGAVAAGTLIAGLATLWRLRGEALAPYAWAPALLGLAVLIAGFVVAAMKKRNA